MSPALASLLRRLSAGVFSLFFIVAATAQTSGVVAGRAFDSTTGAVLRGADITVAGSPVRTTTDADGAYLLSLPAGSHRIAVDYLGYEPRTKEVTVTAGATVSLDFTLGTEVVQLGSVRVVGERTGQARALNQQRSAQNISNIISSDFAGQFPDKTIADAVKRLPGVTVETDRDTGGAEGRYITLRGMSADFNAVTIDGVRVNATDFDGITRRVPLDVVSSDVADQIEVTKALRPDQDADSIGGAVNIRTRSAFSQKGRASSFKAGLNTSSLHDEYTSDYPFDQTGYEAAATYSDLLGAKQQFGFSIGANYRDRVFLKQRNSTTGWNDTLGYRLGTSTTVNPLRGFIMDSAVLQHYYDDIEGSGLNGSLEWRPNDDHRIRFLASTNVRETNRGRQRQVLFFPLFRLSDGSVGGITGTPTVTGDTYTSLSASGNTVRREVRDFDELQRTSTVALEGKSQLGEMRLDYLAGYNWANWDGGGASSLQAQFQNAGFTTRYTITPGDAAFTSIGAVQTTSGLDRNDPSIAGVYTMRNLLRGTREYWDDEFNGAVDATRDLTLAGLPIQFKAGAKFRSRTRDLNETVRSYNQNANWSLTGYTGQPDIPSLIARYRATGTSDGRYDYGYFLDPTVVRNVSDTLIARGLLTPLSTNAFNSLYNDYSAREDITSGYLMGQASRGRLTVLAGLRAEQTKTRFETFNVVDGVPVAIAPERDYTDWLPGLHLRFDLSKNLVVRGAYTETIARPTFNQLNPRATISTTSDTVSRGNIDLKPVYAHNFDLAIERYLGSVGYLSAGVFHKDIKNSVYRSTQSEIFESEPARVTQPRNAKGGTLTGVELAFDTQLKFLPAPLDGFGVTVNYTYTHSELDSGLPALAGVKLPLFDQVGDTVNASLYYEKGPARLRLSLHHRSEVLFDLATDNVLALARYEAPSTTLDFTASYRVWRNWTVYTEFSNLTNEPSHGYNGSESLRLDYNEFTGWSAVLGVRWNL
ncbi:MAG: TonB-dependent receptor [Opitutaceae bacterium]|nr:TonB-dependent receptor [Opitutaceae bacterium]